jgi:hypothetical protein
MNRQQEKKIIRSFFYGQHSIRTISGIYNVSKIEVGKIIQRHKKKYNIR